MIIIASNGTPERSALEAEYVIDALYGEGPKALVARLVLDGKEMEEIGSRLKEKFPGHLASVRKSSLSSMVHEVKSSIDRFLSDDENLRKMTAELNTNA